MNMPYEKKTRLHTIFLENVRACRDDLGLTQADMARRMKITQGSYAQIEAGRRNPTIGMVERVAKALRTDVLELLSSREAATAQ
jgi:transcriptional regulator with XRE-family HTH domain